ncbi:DUF7948 domain-containing protein [Flavobacterium panici]|uniref:Gliding motility-associated C-terminal domain-containing protein n=1 Tax=Flavobacterium panici TaxID=2654843 RepID=A0A9N8J5K3_9FLAO|nr:T9SS type B sorting domain-containing protein [Flavobacterium panici]CAC9975642.1 hypothetical protein FLAPXU55_03358 [Flavobacterium panici]
MKHKLLFVFFIITIQLFSQNKNQSIGFKENKGQIVDQKGKPNTAVKYLLNTNGLNVQLKKNGFSYDIYEVKKTPFIPSKTAKTLPDLNPRKDHQEKPEFNLEYIFHRIDIDFVNSNSKVELISEQKSTDFDNYYNVPNKPEGIIGVYQFKQVTYKNIYPNIDVVFTIPNDPKKTVEYNFVIHPQGKISDIQLKFNGAETDLVDNKIQINVRFGKMEETLPASWIEDQGTKKEIEVGYTKIKKNVYGFSSSNNDSDRTVIIDPVPTRLWGTFYGDHTGSGQVLSNSSISTDSFGNIYVAGSTNAQNSSYATTGAHQTTQSSSYLNGIIEKFSPNGNRLWGTYYGGQNYCAISDIKIDFQDNVIVMGTTQDPTNISTVGSYKPNLGGYQDAFLAKFNNSGVRLWATYFGGEYEDSGFAIDVDNNNNIYMIGLTNSTTGIAINSKFQTHINVDPAFSNTIDGFLTKFGPTGNLIWSTYVGGENRDMLNDIVVKNNFLVIGGTTYSFNNVSTPGVFQELHDPITHPDGVVYKFSLNGDRIWATYYGGEQIEDIYAVEIDDENNIYIGGETASNNNITTSNSFESSNPFSYKGFFAKLNTNGKRIWGTYIGEAHIYSIVFRNNSIYLGATNFGFSYSRLTTPCSYRSNKHFESYIAKFSKEADFIWGTDIGGNSYHSPTKIALDQNNNIFASSISSENNGIADAISYQSNVLGTHNYFLMKFEEPIILGIPKAESNSPVCIDKTLELKASGGTNYLWTGPNGFTSTDQNPTITNATTANSGEYSCLITGTGGCDDTKKITVVIGDIEAPVPTITTLPTITGDCNTIINTIPTAVDACAGQITGTTTSPLSYNLPGTYTIVWNYDDGNGNSSKQNQIVTITNQPLPVANSPQTFCVDKNATLNDIQITGQNIKWYSNLTAGTLISPTTVAQDKATYYASQTINGCESERVPVTINIQVTFPPTGNVNQPFCSGQNPTIADIQVMGTAIKWYDAVSNGSLLAETTNLVNGQTYYASQTENNCESQRLGVTVSIVNTPSAPVLNGSTAFCKKENAILSDIQISGQNIKWYDTNFSAASLPNTTLLEDNRTYYASQTIGCEGDRTPVLVRVYDTPLPTGDNNKQFCIDEIATIENIAITGTSLKWYDAATNGNSLSETTLLQNGIYYVTQTLNNCESERFAVTVKIQDTQIPIADSPQIFCIQKNASINDIDITGQNIKWFESISSNSTLSESTLLENGHTYYASQTISNCESDRIPVMINILGATTGDCINFVDELPFPKFFTPNNDNFNDHWTIDSAYLAPNTAIRIFDRYGKLIKELAPNASWDGTYLGHQEPASDYWFTVTRLNGTEFRGHFSLKR